jgi:lysozyme family protein
MKKNFEKAVNAVLDHEGGYVNDPADPGGETNYGISKSAHPDIDIKKLTKTRAKEIYHQDYWQACSCDDLPSGIDILVFDAAVNQGPRFARRTLQQVAGATADGVIGPKTLAAVEAANKNQALVVEFCARRAVRYGQNRNFDLYGLGWMRRLSAMHHLAATVKQG